MQQGTALGVSPSQDPSGKKPLRTLFGQCLPRHVVPKDFHYQPGAWYRKTNVGHFDGTFCKFLRTSDISGSSSHISRISSHISWLSPCISQIASFISRSSSSISDFSSPISRPSSRISHFTSDISRTTFPIPQITLLISRFGSVISQPSPVISQKPSHISDSSFGFSWEGVLVAPWPPIIKAMLLFMTLTCLSANISLPVE